MAGRRRATHTAVCDHCEKRVSVTRASMILYRHGVRDAIGKLTPCSGSWQDPRPDTFEQVRRG